MASPITNTFLTYDTIGIREDLADIIYNIDPLDTPFMSSIGRGGASAITHEWQTDALDPAGVNTTLEGDDTTFDAIDPTIRPNNILQISSKNVIISGTNEAVDSAGRQSEMAYQVAKKGKSLKRDLEFTITQNQMLLGGDLTTARALAGYENWVGPIYSGSVGVVTSSRGTSGVDPVITNGTPSTAVVDGTQRPLLESFLKSVIQDCWTNGGEPSLLITGPFNKTTVSSFVGNSTRYSLSPTMELTTAIDIYVSDFGSHRIVADRFSRDRSLLVVDPTLWSVDYLRPFQQYELAKTGDAEKRLINTEFTLRSSNRTASGIVADLTTA